MNTDSFLTTCFT